MVWAAYMGLPLALGNLGEILALTQQKLKEGKDLIRYFCQPCKPTKANGQRTRNLPHHAPDKWQLFKTYNCRDVDVEQGIKTRLANFPVPDNIWEEYHLDQEINDRGILLDMALVKNAIAVDCHATSHLKQRMQYLTSLDNPNSVEQLKHWLTANSLSVDTLDKKTVADLLKTAMPSLVQEVLTIRQSLAKSSVKKYKAMEACVCKDNRVRGTLQFYGASRTGRWSGRLLQCQNLPANKMPGISQARELVRQGNHQALEILYPSTPDVLSELIRTAIIPKPGHQFIVADFSAIEARVIAWLAKETWRNDVFATHGKIYEASASQMFRVPLEEITKTSPLRQKGKIAELALGYGGSVGALKVMGALDMGLSEEELQPLVAAWRLANPNIVRFWWDVDRAAKTAVEERTTTKTHDIIFSYQSGFLFITLPSGRRLSYVKPRIGENRFGGTCITYEGTGATKKWERIESYGPKFVENIVQALSRDILAHALKSLKSHNIVLHVHDEIVIESPTATSLETICQQMSQTPPWATGLELRAEGFACPFYRKD